ncbi:MAG: DUF4115 domain-containing protein [Pseudomonadales bacterium]
MTEVPPQSDPAGTTPGPESGSVQAAEPGPGALLLAAREHLGVSTQEVADELKLPTHVIEALENDDYVRMPPSVFSRGYLRSYARLLDLDPEVLLKLYPQLSQEPELSTQVAVVPFWQKMDMVQIAAIIGVVLVVLLVVLSLLFGDAEEEASDSPALEQIEGAPAAAAVDPAIGSTTTVPVADVPAGTKVQPEVNTDSAEDVIRVEVEEEVPRPPTSVNRTSRAAEVPRPPASVNRTSRAAEVPAADLPGPASASEVSDPPAPVPLSAGVRRITAAGDDRLTLTFSADCWVEVRSLDGGNLYSDLNRSGRTLELVGRGPFRVRLGYAPGVELSFNGERVPLAARTRNNVANLVLGQ